jgi:hypothetical protein
MRQRYGEHDWECSDLPRDDGEHPAGSLFIKNHCEKTTDGQHLILEQRYFQKKGQEFVDPQTGKPQPQAYESAARFEAYDAQMNLRKTGAN